jgi:hypothetical protein
VAFSRSSDGGRHFSAPRLVTGKDGVSMPVVVAGPAGAVYVGYALWAGGADTPDADTMDLPRARAGRAAPAATVANDAQPSLPPLPPAVFKVAASADGGDHFAAPVAIHAVPSEIVAAADQRLPTGPSLAAAPHDGTVYAAFAAYDAGATATEILLSRSCDGGHTWGSAVRLATHLRAGRIFSFQPQAVVDETGVADVSSFVLAHGRVAVVLTRVTAQDRRAGPWRRITSTPFDPALGLPGGKHGRWWIGDYQGLAAAGGHIYPLWTDTRTGHIEIMTAALPAAAT